MKKIIASAALALTLATPAVSCHAEEDISEVIFQPHYLSIHESGRFF